MTYILLRVCCLAFQCINYSFYVFLIMFFFSGKYEYPWHRDSQNINAETLTNQSLFIFLCQDQRHDEILLLYQASWKRMCGIFYEASLQITFTLSTLWKQNEIFHPLCNWKNMPHVLCTEMLCVSLIFFSPLSLFPSNAIEKPLKYIDDIAVAIQSELYHFKSSSLQISSFSLNPFLSGPFHFKENK